MERSNLENYVLCLYQKVVLILDSGFWGTTYLGGKFGSFFNIFHVLGVFLGEFGILGLPQEIAGINTDQKVIPTVLTALITFSFGHLNVVAKKQTAPLRGGGYSDLPHYMLSL